MKFKSLPLVLLCLCSTLAFSQDEKLSVTASAIFDNFNGILSNTEKNTIAELSGFEYDSETRSFSRTTYQEEANEQFQISAYPMDLTKDGILEVGIIYQPLRGSGKKGVASLLFVKNKRGFYQMDVDVSGVVHFHNLGSMVVPDVVVINEQYQLPIYRWDGNAFNPHKLATRGKLKKFNLTSMPQASNRFLLTQTGE